MEEEIKQASKNKNKGVIWKIILGIFVAITIFGSIIGYSYYEKIFSPNVNLGNAKSVNFHIKTNSSYQEVLSELRKKRILKSINSFDWVAEKKNYPSQIKAGMYVIRNGMSNNSLVDLLRSGKQKPVRVTFNNVRIINELAGKVAKQIEADSASIVAALADAEFTKTMGYTPETIISIFLPDTYEFYWNTSAKKFVNKMYKYHKTFWTDKRKNKAESLGLSPLEISVLASIVQAEQSVHNNEKPIIAGLYLNRLRKKWALESDPTLVYALGDFSIKRVLAADKEVDSPFNTYKHPGLPPAPINLPEKSSLIAVLNFKTHDYMFMCAKDDFSGYHFFSKTLRQHKIYANRYHAALSKRGIKRY